MGIPTAALIFAAGVTFEELIYRGAIFRIVEESLGTTVALAVSALLFGLSHLGNNGASLASALSIAVTGGITSSLTYGVMGWTQPITPDFERNALRAAHVPPLVWP